MNGPPGTEEKKDPRDVDASEGVTGSDLADLQSGHILGISLQAVKQTARALTWTSDKQLTAGGGHPERTSGRPDDPSGPWYRRHTGTFFQKLANLNESRKGHFKVKIYPSGVILTSALGINNPPPDGEDTRGEIDGFSDKAARRLREAFMSTWVPDFELWAVTLTTHAIKTPPEWRAIMKRFRMAIIRKGWGGIWRVELQKRKAPHAHVAMWLPKDIDAIGAVTHAWLIATGELHDADALEHAVMGKRIPQDETGWAVYMALHDGKRKAAQLGWLGKQWGVWNADLFVTRKAESSDLDPREHPIFLRVLRNLDVSQRRALNRSRDQKLLNALPSELRASFVIVPDKVKPRRIHRGNLLRCVRGETVIAIIGAVKSGRIYPANLQPITKK